MKRSRGEGMAENKRKHPRLSINTSAEFLIRRNGTSKLIITRVWNISQGGVCLCSMNPIKKGTQLKLIRLNTSLKGMSVEGIVSWLSELDGRYFMGVRFENEYEIEKYRRFDEFVSEGIPHDHKASVGIIIEH
jgi:hypothetical protein